MIFSLPSLSWLNIPISSVAFAVGKLRPCVRKFRENRKQVSKCENKLGKNVNFLLIV